MRCLEYDCTLRQNSIEVYREKKWLNYLKITILHCGMFTDQLSTRTFFHYSVNCVGIQIALVKFTIFPHLVMLCKHFPTLKSYRLQFLKLPQPLDINFKF